MKPQLVAQFVAANPPAGVFLGNGKPAKNPEDTHIFCVGGYTLYRKGLPFKECIAAATDTGFREIEP